MSPNCSDVAILTNLISCFLCLSPAAWRSFLGRITSTSDSCSGLIGTFAVNSLEYLACAFGSVGRVKVLACEGRETPLTFNEFRVGIAGRALANVQLDEELLEANPQPGPPAVLPCPSELATLASSLALLDTKWGTPAGAECVPPRFEPLFPLDDPLETSVRAPALAPPGNGGIGNRWELSVPPPRVERAGRELEVEFASVMVGANRNA